jgi:phosphate-selective porin OprO/OprP
MHFGGFKFRAAYRAHHRVSYPHCPRHTDRGDLTSRVRYIVASDLATGNVAPRDIFLGWGKDNEGGEFRAGHLREPFRLEGRTASPSLAFMERSSINHLDPARNWGLGYSW